MPSFTPSSVAANATPTTPLIKHGPTPRSLRTTTKPSARNRSVSSPAPTYTTANPAALSMTRATMSTSAAPPPSSSTTRRIFAILSRHTSNMATLATRCILSAMERSAPRRISPTTFVPCSKATTSSVSSTIRNSFSKPPNSSPKSRLPRKRTCSSSTAAPAPANPSSPSTSSSSSPSADSSPNTSPKTAPPRGLPKQTLWHFHQDSHLQSLQRLGRLHRNRGQYLSSTHRRRSASPQ